MAVEKDITMKQFNGMDYDTLYPKTTIDQVNISQDINDYYSLPAGSTFDDVLKKIPDSVGNIQYSVKTAAQMGDKYLPCDGSALDTAAYPELAALLKEKKYPTSASDFTKHTITIDTSSWSETLTSSSVKQLDYINGYYVAKATLNSSGTGNRIIYSTSLDTPFTIVDLNFNVSWLQYCNGYIVASGYRGSDTTFSCKVATNPAGPWSDGPSFTGDDFNSSYTGSLQSVNVIYDGTRYVFGVVIYDGFNDYFATCSFSSLSNTVADGYSWPSKRTNQGQDTLFYVNGYYIFIINRQEFVYSTSWNGPFTNAAYDDNNTSQYFGGIVYYKERWYFFASAATADTKAYVSSTSAINSTYTAQANVLTSSMYYNINYANYVEKAGLKMLVGYYQNSFTIAVFDDSADGVQTITIPYLNGTEAGYSYASSSCFSDVYTIGSPYTSFTLFWFQINKFLPNIPSVDVVNAYIKALPGM